MRINYETHILPTEITQPILNKIETLYLAAAYGKDIDKWIFPRPIGTTITVEEIQEELNQQLEKAKESTEKLEELEFIDTNLTINNKTLEFYYNPCYGAYIEGMEYPDIHLKIKFIVEKGKFYIYLENEDWNCRPTPQSPTVIKKWNKMIANIYYTWHINNIPVHITPNNRPKVRKLINSSSK